MNLIIKNNTYIGHFLTAEWIFFQLTISCGINSDFPQPAVEISQHFSAETVVSYDVLITKTLNKLKAMSTQQGTISIADEQHMLKTHNILHDNNTCGEIMTWLK